LGNLMETFLLGGFHSNSFGDSKEDSLWLVGEESGYPLRSLKDPEAMGQPSSFWGPFYVPPASFYGQGNDYGGVHQNSTLLSHLGYTLSMAGLSGREAFSFWASLGALCFPDTDYKALKEPLPFVLQASSLEKYEEALLEALKEASFGQEKSDAPPQGFSLVQFSLESVYISLALEEERWPYLVVAFYPVEAFKEEGFFLEEGDAFLTWPYEGEIRAVLLPGRYHIALWLLSQEGEAEVFWVLSENGWVQGDSPLSGKAVSILPDEVIDFLPATRSGAGIY
ncbi:MAG: M4 family metallopeptidase, partial [Blautia sp.]|nr:M4 family metallopeptidase [Blautia sp.]